VKICLNETLEIVEKVKFIIKHKVKTTHYK